MLLDIRHGPPERESRSNHSSFLLLLLARRRYRPPHVSFHRMGILLSSPQVFKI